MQALVTGAPGFCGRHVMSHLLQAGYDVSGLDPADRIELDDAIHKTDSDETARARVRCA